MADFVPGESDIKIELEGRGELWLRGGNMNTCILISRSDMGEPKDLADKCLKLNFDAICYVIACGIGVKVDDALMEQVFRTGTIKLFGACLRLIHIVSNGGRPPKKLEEVVDIDPLANTSNRETTSSD